MTEPRKPLTIDTEGIDPSSAEKPKSPNASLILSPRADLSKKIKDQQSPNAKQSKLTALKKLYEKSLDERSKIEHLLNPNIIEDKKQEIDGYRTILNARQSEATSSNANQEAIEQRRKEIEHLKSVLNSAVQQRNQNAKSKTQNVTTLRSELDKLSQAIESQNSQRVKAEENILSQIENDRKNFEAQISELQQKKAQLQSNNQKAVGQNQSQKARVDEVSNSLNGQSPSQISNSDLLNREQALKMQNTQKRNEVQMQKDQLQKIQSVEVSHVTQNLSVSQTKKDLQSEISDLKSKKSELLKGSSTGEKQLKNSIQKVQKDIERQKMTNKKVNNRIVDIEKEKESFEEKITNFKKNQKPKFEEKVPEQVLQERKKKEKLQKKVTEQRSKIAKYDVYNDKLVPPSVLQNLQKKIDTANENNKKWAHLSKENAKTLNENKELDEEKERLEWEVNPDIKTADLNRQKEENRSQFIEEQVTLIRKNALQSTNKLEEYMKSYPEFVIPEKKPKKVAEPLPPAPENKKKKSKSGISKSESVEQNDEEKEEKPEQAIPIAKTSSKKEEEKKPKQQNNPNSNAKKGNKKKR